MVMLPNIRIFLSIYTMVLASSAFLAPAAAAPSDELFRECRHWIKNVARGRVPNSCASVIGISEGAFSSRSDDLVDLLTELTHYYLNLGDFRRAEAAAVQAARIAETRMERVDPLRVKSMIRLATVYLRQERYEESEKLNRQALALARDSLGGQTQELANAQENLAMLELAHGRYDAAITALRRVLQTRLSQEGALPVSVGATLVALASALEKQGSFAEANRLYEQATSWFRDKYGPHSPHVALCMLNGARSLQAGGQLKQAELVYRYALGILKQDAETPKHYLARAYTDLGLLYQAQGEYGLAQGLLQLGLLLREESLGSKHSLVAESLHRLAVNLLHRDDVQASIELFWRSVSILESGLRLPLSEARLASLLDQQRIVEDSIYGGLLKFPDSSELKQLAMTVALLRKGRSEDAGRRTNRSTLAVAKTRAQEARLADWKTSRAEYEQLILQGLGELSPEDYRARLHELRLKIEDLELALLSATSQSDSRPIPEPKNIVSKVASQLDQRSLLVEMVLTRPLRTHSPQPSAANDGTRYMALVLDAGGKIEAYDLGDSAPIDRQVSALLERLQDRRLDPQPAAQTVYQSLFSPMTAVLPSSGRIFVSADGSLHLIPFAALHNGKNYLIDRYQFIYLSSGRDLLQDYLRGASGPPVVVADPEFSAELQPPADSPKPSEEKEDGSTDRGTAGLYAMLTGAARLPGTRKEAVLLSGLWPNAKLLLGGEAEETHVRRIAAPLFLHLATHGVFLEDQPNTATGPGGQSARALVPLAAVSGANEPVGVAEGAVSKPLSMAGGDRISALSRSALLLAGVVSAHRKKDRYHDGLLTADEVREMNLWGTKLVVLSACDSGRGAIRTGQGVYGLRRSFFSAGAETLVTSLWRVADGETSELMAEYYQRLSKGGSRIGSLSDAMVAVRKRHPHPYYWAPFIGIGRDAPLDEPSTPIQAVAPDLPSRTEPTKQRPSDSSGERPERQATESGPMKNSDRPPDPLMGSNIQKLEARPDLSLRAQVFLVGPPEIKLQAANRRDDDTSTSEEELITCQPPCGLWIPRQYQLEILSGETARSKPFSLNGFTGPQITLHCKVNYRRKYIGRLAGSALGFGLGAFHIGLVLLSLSAINKDLLEGRLFSAGLGLSITGVGLTATGGTLFGINRTRFSVEQIAGRPMEE